MKLSSKNIWVTSDTHYSHVNICRGVSRWGTYDPSGNFQVDQENTRNFDSVESMNDAIVNGINENVQSNDFLIHLGDWSFDGIDKVTEFREKINCKNVVLICGNHDHHIIRNNSLQRLFNHTTSYDELKLYRDLKKSKTFILCHYPIISWNGQYYGNVMLHGHQHNKPEKILTQKNRIDVGLDGSDYFRPYHIDELIDLINQKNEFCQFDKAEL